MEITKDMQCVCYFGMTEVTTDITDCNDRPVAVGDIAVITLLLVPILVNNNVWKFIFY